MVEYMEKFKKEILEYLSDNARYTPEQLARMTGVTEEEVTAAIAQLEEDGVIVKYSAIINTEALHERNVQALIEVKVAPQKLKGFDSYAEDLYLFPEVTSLYLMSGTFDLAVFVEGKDITDISKFVAEKLSVIDGITGVQTHFILKKYKIEGHVTKPSVDHERQTIHQ